MADLFDSISPLREMYKPYLGEYWSQTFTIRQLEQLDIILKKLNRAGEYFPPTDQVFKIYANLPPERIRVVILAQDPYYNGNATGYAFACQLKISPSLNQIMRAVAKDLKMKGNRLYDADLQYLVNQGVFLLNTNLTVAPGKPASHNHLGWTTFTGATLEIIANFKRPVVWMIWGRPAYDLIQGRIQHFAEANKHKIMFNEHPVAAARTKRKWHCNHFSECNAYFALHNEPPIKWI